VLGVPQELEKFKFVLDYKIKELKKQVRTTQEGHTPMHHTLHPTHNPGDA
jgi:hypothetical protein